MFFLAEAQGALRTSMFILFLPQTPLRVLRPGESLFVFFSRKGAKIAKIKTNIYLITAAPLTYAELS